VFARIVESRDAHVCPSRLIDLRRTARRVQRDRSNIRLRVLSAPASAGVARAPRRTQDQMRQPADSPNGQGVQAAHATRPQLGCSIASSLPRAIHWEAGHCTCVGRRAKPRSPGVRETRPVCSPRVPKSPTGPTRARGHGLMGRSRPFPVFRRARGKLARSSWETSRAFFFYLEDR
jgi:hypothetical protein